MGCYIHPAVPAAVRCRDCGKEICSTCSLDSICPGCRLGRAMKRESVAQRVLAGSAAAAPGAGGASGPIAAAPGDASHDDRLLAAIAYPFWPLALLMLFLPGRSKFLRFNVVQALLVNLLGVVLYALALVTAHLWVIGWQSALLLPFIVPLWFLFDVYLAARAYGGHTTRVPIAADYAQKYAA